ncbi:MAG: sugar ABC transporter ATP-binding protein [Planctomycetes bacterium]|nr:sugar ABC transporter ATP-binding protein [Planctomycetota bacterium]
MTDSPDNIAFTARAICKSFPGVKALSDINLDLKVGEVHALVGENGAGKSTLAKIIAGLHQLDSGQMLIGQASYKPLGRKNAERNGVRIVMQELNLVSNLSVAENIFIEKLPSRLGFIDYKKLNADAGDITKNVGLAEMDVTAQVSRLGIGQQQMVEIAAGLSQKCDILILDEPTASLTDTETELLFAQIQKLKNEQVSIIYISHHIDEIMRITDSVTILRDGKVVSTNPTSELTAEKIVNKMVGRELEHNKLRHNAKLGEVVLRVEKLTRGKKVRNVSFELRRGEILGLAGLIGSGRTETMRLIFGADKADTGDIYLYGSKVPAKINNPRQAVKNRIALVTEDRKEQGLLLPLSVTKNISITNLPRLSRFGWINQSKEKAITADYVEKLSVRIASPHQPVENLSGGNQQKVVIAKWLYRDCEIIIFDEPTRGIDVGAKFEIYQMLDELANQGKAIIVVSSDLKELMAISDRIAVMSDGKIAAEFSSDNFSEEKITAAAFSEYVNQKKERP